jgi:hypothetical protein
MTDGVLFENYQRGWLCGYKSALAVCVASQNEALTPERCERLDDASFRGWLEFRERHEPIGESFESGVVEGIFYASLADAGIAAVESAAAGLISEFEDEDEDDDDEGTAGEPAGFFVGVH